MNNITNEERNTLLGICAAIKSQCGEYCPIDVINSDVGAVVSFKQFMAHMPAPRNLSIIETLEILKRKGIIGAGYPDNFWLTYETLKAMSPYVLWERQPILTF